MDPADQQPQAKLHVCGTCANLTLKVVNAQATCICHLPGQKKRGKVVALHARCAYTPSEWTAWWKGL